MVLVSLLIALENVGQFRYKKIIFAHKVGSQNHYTCFNFQLFSVLLLSKTDMRYLQKKDLTIVALLWVVYTDIPIIFLHSISIGLGIMVVNSYR